MQQSLHTAAEIHERSELADRRHAAAQHRSGLDRLPHLGRGRALFLLEQRATGDDQVPPPFRVLGDPERIYTPVVLRRFGPDEIDLRERTEPALMADADLVSALDHLL